MAKLNRFQRRQEKRRRAYYPSIRNDEIAYYEPESGQVEVTKLIGRDRRFITPHLEKSPTFAELHKIPPGSAEEHSYINARMKQGLPRYDDRKTGTVLG